MIAAGGPSLTTTQLDYIKGKAKLIVINNTFKLAPWADLLYACDGVWWERYYHEVREKFTGELWTQDKWAMDQFGVNRMKSIKANSLSVNPRVIHQGSNSGFQALNLAIHMGARDIVLLGYDMRYKGKKRHWHGDHKGKLKNPAPATLDMFNNAFDTIKDDHLQGAKVVNCSPKSELRRFPLANLEDVL